MALTDYDADYVKPQVAKYIAMFELQFGTKFRTTYREESIVLLACGFCAAIEDEEIAKRVEAELTK